MLYLATVLPSTLLVARIARRMRAEPDSVI
jgi:hypothetical protein